MFFHPLPTARTCRSQGQFPGGRRSHRPALSPLSLWESPAWGHTVPGQHRPGDSQALTSLLAVLWWLFVVFTGFGNVQRTGLEWEKNQGAKLLPGTSGNSSPWETEGSSTGFSVLPAGLLSFTDSKAKITPEPSTPRASTSLERSHCLTGSELSLPFYKHNKYSNIISAR